MFSFSGNAHEAGPGGRSGAAGIPVRGSLMGRFSLCITSVTFLFVHCGSLVSTLVLLTETECPVAVQWSPTPVGMVRLACSLLMCSREGKHHVTTTSS